MQAVNLLLKAGADPAVVNKGGKTPKGAALDKDTARLFK